MRRLFWTSLGIGLGATAGILVARRLRRTSEAFMPSSLAGAAAGRLSGLTGAVKDFVAEVRDGMAEREAELYLQLTEPEEPS